MKFIKKNRNKKIVIGIIIGLVILIIGVLLYMVVRTLLPGNDNKYGNRLDGMDAVVIRNEQIDVLKNEINEINDVKSINYRLQGRAVKITMTVSNETAVEVSKGYANKLLGYFDDEQKEYYDIEVYIVSDAKESEAYPICGQKHKTSKSFQWAEYKKKETSNK